MLSIDTLNVDAAAPTCASTIHTAILYATTTTVPHDDSSASVAEHAKAACNLL